MDSDPHWQPGSNHRLGHIMDLLGPGLGDRILDVGCGTGVFAENYIEHGAHVTGINLSFEMLAYGRQKPRLSGMLAAVASSSHSVGVFC